MRKVSRVLTCGVSMKIRIGYLPCWSYNEESLKSTDLWGQYEDMHRLASLLELQ